MARKQQQSAASTPTAPPNHKSQWTEQLRQLQQRIAADTVTCYRLEGALWALDQLVPKETSDGRK